MAGEVHAGEEEVAEFGFDSVGVSTIDFGTEFGGFLGEFVEEAGGVGPVEAYFCGLRAELGGFESRGHGAGYFVE